MNIYNVEVWTVARFIPWKSRASRIAKLQPNCMCPSTPIMSGPFQALLQGLASYLNTHRHALLISDCSTWFSCSVHLSPTNLATIGQSTSAHPERNTTTTAGRRCPSGRSPKNGWRGRKWYRPGIQSLKVWCAAVFIACLLILREQRQKEATKTAVVNSFPKDRDYRREAMQASAAPGFTAASK